MTLRNISIAAVFSIAMLSPAFAGPSAEHAESSVVPSAGASVEGSLAIVEGGKAVSAVPLIVFGNALNVTGSALKSSGQLGLTVGAGFAGIAPQGIDIIHQNIKLGVVMKRI